jgi:xanthine dehydrogenase iron-sulfur cluster and FAD-binding subunit A
MIIAASRIRDGASPDAIREALVGNVCRCTGYASIVRAVQRASRMDNDG